MRSHTVQLREPTEQLYSLARDRGRRAMFWAALVGRSRCLLALEEIWPGSQVSTTEQSNLDVGTRLVPIAKIVGSAGRCGDFDCDFNPLHDRNRERWLRIAAARRRGTPLPPVDLVQVGGLYYVQDGHHRISVARALGETDIEARVTVWQVIGMLPWETQPGPNAQGSNKLSTWKALVGRPYGEILAYVRTLRSDQTDRTTHVGL